MTEIGAVTHVWRSVFLGGQPHAPSRGWRAIYLP